MPEKQNKTPRAKADDQEVALARPRWRRGKLLDDFNHVMSDENGQAATEMAIMLAMLTGSIVLTNKVFDAFLTKYIDGVMFFLKHP